MTLGYGSPFDQRIDEAACGRITEFDFCDMRPAKSALEDYF